MELRKLGEQYKNDLDKLKVQIEKAKALQKRTKSEHRYYELDRKIKILENMYAEVYSTAEHLIKYYDE